MQSGLTVVETAQQRSEASDFLRGEFERYVIDADRRRRLNEAGRVNLLPEHCERLQYVLELYSEAQRNNAAYRPNSTVTTKVARLERELDALIKSLEDVDFRPIMVTGQPSLREMISIRYVRAFPRSDISPRRFLKILVHFRNNVHWSLGNRKEGRPNSQNLGWFLLQLVPIYKDAKGGSVLVSRGLHGQRTSRFISFAWVLMEALSPEARIKETLEALLSWWEKNAPAELRSQRTNRTDGVPAKGKKSPRPSSRKKQSRSTSR